LVFFEKNSQKGLSSGLTASSSFGNEQSFL